MNAETNTGISERGNWRYTRKVTVVVARTRNEVSENCRRLTLKSVHFSEFSAN